MNNTQCKGLKFQNEKMTFEVCYSLINKSLDRISIKGIIRPKNSNNETYALFQFYKENSRINNSDWILDKNASSEEDVPYYCIINYCNFNWSDKPKYNLNSKGKIIYNTFIAEVRKEGHDNPKNWKYVMILGFYWGMKSNNGTTIEKIPIKNICKWSTKVFVHKLQSKCGEANFETQEPLIRGKTSNIAGMW